jgi:predicted transglutaminase-like cysteine proteinase
MNNERWKLMCDINKEVNIQELYVENIPQYKKHKLVGTGKFNHNYLKLVRCRAEDKYGNVGKGDLHEVLIVFMTDGKYVLDERSEDPLKWNLFPYEWLKVFEDGEWKSIGNLLRN